MDIWKKVQYYWTALYTGLPLNFIVDQESQSQKTFGGLGTMHNVHIEQIGIQSHNSIGISDRYKKPYVKSILGFVKFIWRSTLTLHFRLQRNLSMIS